MSWHKVRYKVKRGQQPPVIKLPTSKSISNRLLILQYLSTSPTEISNLSNANDTTILRTILSSSQLPEEIDCQDAGTVLRFLTCLCSTEAGRKFTLTGKQRLLERPMKPVIGCLIELGAQISHNGNSISIAGQQLIGKPLNIAGDVSSQFITGLCLIAPRIKNGLVLTIAEPIYSKPYIDITLRLLELFNVESTFINNQILIPKQKIIGQNIKVEADWSSACFFYSFLLLQENITTMTILDVKSNDIQGDKHIVKLGALFGITTEFNKTGASITKKNVPKLSIEIPLENYPDLAIPLLTTCAFKFPNCTFSGLEHLRHKESDRIDALGKNLEKFGITLIEEKGNISFTGQPIAPQNTKVQIECFNDHRIAMSFALLVSLGYKIELDNLSCINKSFPTFWSELSLLGVYLEN